MRARPTHWAAVVLVASALAAACGGDDPTPTLVPSTVPSTDPTPSTDPVPTTDAPATSVSGTVPVGFGTIAARVTSASGETCDVCLWLADTEALRGRGLMQVTDLGGADGMAFRYDEPRTGAFTMRNTLLPLSIAFYAPDGTYLDAFDMTPCTAEPCPSYPTPPDFGVAVEVPAGGLDELLMLPGSTIELLAEGCALG